MARTKQLRNSETVLTPDEIRVIKVMRKGYGKMFPVSMRTQERNDIIRSLYDKGIINADRFLTDKGKTITLNKTARQNSVFSTAIAEMMYREAQALLNQGKTIAQIRAALKRANPDAKTEIDWAVNKLAREKKNPDITDKIGYAKPAERRAISALIGHIQKGGGVYEGYKSSTFGHIALKFPKLFETKTQAGSDLIEVRIKNPRNNVSLETKEKRNPSSYLSWLENRFDSIPAYSSFGKQETKERYAIYLRQLRQYPNDLGLQETTAQYGKYLGYTKRKIFNDLSKVMPKRNVSSEFQQAASDEKERLEKELERVESVSNPHRPYRVNVMERDGTISSFEYKDLDDAKKFAHSVHKDLAVKVAVFDTRTGKRLLALGLAKRNTSQRKNVSNPKYKKRYSETPAANRQTALKWISWEVYERPQLRGKLTVQKQGDYYYLVYADEEIKRNSRSNKNPESFNSTKIDELSAMFQGEITGEQIKTVGSSYTPDLMARIGQLSLMKVRNGKDLYELRFKGDAWLGMDARKNLHVSGKDSRLMNVRKPRQGQLTLVGNLEQVNYITAKKHIENGELVEYYHKLGEVDGVQPTLWIDSDRYLVINAGNYDIGVHGIEN